MNSLIQCSHADFGYENQDAVVDVTMEVNPGDYVCIVGENGSGKSTLMKIIMGIYQPDEGELVIAGDKISSFKPSAILAKGVYMVPQEPMLFPNMTVEENVLIGFKEAEWSEKLG